MTIKSFRGLIADGAQDTVVLHSNDGSIGYRIVKFELMGNTPGAPSSDMESVTKIYKTQQDPVTADIDFSDQVLLAAGIYTQNSSAFNYPSSLFTIFDSEIFNQDIYITHQDLQNLPINYYIELEQIKLDLNENTVATLKDIRNTDRLPTTAP